MLVLCALILAAAAAGADELYSERGFFIDLPEGFAFTEGDGVGSFSFESPDGTLIVNILVYEAGRHVSARAGVEDLTRKLTALGSPSLFSYAGRDAAMAELSWGSGSSATKAMLFFLENVAPVPPTPGSSAAPAAGSEPGAAQEPKPYEVAILAYAPASKWTSYRELALSVLDGFSADASMRAAPGPVGAKARFALGAASGSASGSTSGSAVASTRLSDTRIAFGSASISASYDKREAAIAQEMVEREYRVLLSYGAIPELTQAAVARFYRMIYRDAAPSLKQLSLLLSKAWDSGQWAGLGTFKPISIDSSATEAASPRYGAPADPRGYAQALLSWTQTWTYERSPDGSDVVNPLSAAMEGRGDCDSRAMVISILLRYESITSILMVSLEAQHALVAVDAPGVGARYPFADTNWLVGETTAHVDIGRIDASQADPAIWFAVEFPY